MRPADGARYAYGTRNYSGHRRNLLADAHVGRPYPRRRDLPLHRRPLRPAMVGRHRHEAGHRLLADYRPEERPRGIAPDPRGHQCRARGGRLGQVVPPLRTQLSLGGQDAGPAVAARQVHHLRLGAAARGLRARDSQGRRQRGLQHQERPRRLYAEEQPLRGRRGRDAGAGRRGVRTERPPQRVRHHEGHLLEPERHARKARSWPSTAWTSAW